MMFAPPGTLRRWTRPSGCLRFLLVVAALFGSINTASAVEKRKLPDYDGRGGPSSPPGRALLWVPRVVLFPFYLTSEYVIRRPLGFLISSAERAKIPALLLDIFLFGPDHKAGIIPIAFVDFGFEPSVGLYAFWDDAGFKGHQLRLHATTWGEDWLAGNITERFVLSDDHSVTLSASGAHRPDYAFYGIGPRTRESALSRYGADKFDARASEDFKFWYASSIQASFSVRSASFRPGNFDGQPTFEERAVEGTFPYPEGYIGGYTAGASHLKLALDTRTSAEPRRAGLRLELDGEQGTIPSRARAAGWQRYRGQLGSFVDLGKNHRILSLSLTTEFADPLGSRDIPFTELPSIGGSGLMAGFRTDRLRDRSLAVATLRYSWPIWIWLNGSLQTALGNVFGEHLKDFDPSLLRWSGAIGFESRQSPDSTLEFVFGFGTETFESGAKVDSLRLTFGARSGL
jgi:hypothetical protein